MTDPRNVGWRKTIRRLKDQGMSDDELKGALYTPQSEQGMEDDIRDGIAEQLGCRPTIAVAPTIAIDFPFTLPPSPIRGSPGRVMRQQRYLEDREERLRVVLGGTK